MVGKRAQGARLPTLQDRDIIYRRGLRKLDRVNL